MKTFFRQDSQDYTGFFRSRIAPFLILFILLILSSSQAQTTIYFPVLTMTGATNDVQFNVKADNNPIIYNSIYYYLPQNGTNFWSTNGVATNSFIPGRYTVSIIGHPRSWKMNVTNTTTVLNSTALGDLTIFGSGIQSIVFSGSATGYLAGAVAYVGATGGSGGSGGSATNAFGTVSNNAATGVGLFKSNNFALGFNTLAPGSSSMTIASNNGVITITATNVIAVTTTNAVNTSGNITAAGLLSAEGITTASDGGGNLGSGGNLFWNADGSFGLLGGAFFVGPAGIAKVSGLTNTALTASKLLGTDASKAETSITVGTGLSLFGTTLSVIAPGNAITNNQSGVTLSGTFSGNGAALYNLTSKIGAGFILGDGVNSNPFNVYTDAVAQVGVMSYNPNLGTFYFPYGGIFTNGVIADLFTGSGAGLSQLPLSGNTVSNFTIQSANIGTYGNITAQELMKPRVGIFTYYANWNGTNWYAGGGGTNVACGVSENIILQLATNMINDGLLAKGHRWMNIDDGWQGTRAANGTLDANTTTFPHGLRWLIDKLHSMGFLVSIFTADDGLTNCGFDGSGGTNAANDAVNWKAWGVDYVVACDIVNGISDLKRRYNSDHLQTALRNANFRGGYQMSISQYTNGTSGYQTWMLSSANSVLLSDTDDADWNKCLATFDIAVAASGQLKRGHYPTLLPFQTGSFIATVAAAFGRQLGQLRVSSAAMVSSDLIYDRSLVAYEGIAETLQSTTNIADFQTNRFVFAIDQDEGFQQPVKAFTNGLVEAWTKRLKGDTALGIPDGAYALMVINRGWATNVNATSITVPITAFGAATNGTATATFLDCWNYSNQIVTAGSKVFDAPTNSCSLWIVSIAPPGFTGTFTGNGSGVTNLNSATAFPQGAIQIFTNYTTWNGGTLMQVGIPYVASEGLITSNTTISTYTGTVSGLTTAGSLVIYNTSGSDKTITIGGAVFGTIDTLRTWTVTNNFALVVNVSIGSKTNAAASPLR